MFINSLGYPGDVVSVDKTKTAQPDSTVSPADPTERDTFPLGAPFSLGGFGFGAFPGFCDAPISSPWLFWQMRRYSAIVLAHTSAVSQIEAGTRSIEIVDDAGKKDLAQQIKEAAEKDLLPPLAEALPGAVEDLHFGHWLQEVIYGLKNGRTAPIRLASFLPGQAVLYVDKYRQFTGYKVGQEFRDAQYAFLSVNAPHIDPILGHSRNENAKEDWWRARQSNLNADKVERKASGIQMMIGAPLGLKFKNADGTYQTMGQMMQTIMNAAVKGETFNVPSTPFDFESIKQNPELAKVELVKVKEFDWGDTGPAMLAHLKRLDVCDRNMIRAWGRPEREMTEGHFGTKAESAVQGALGTTDSELIHARICRQWDAQVTAVWQRTNFGDTGIVIRTKPAPLSDPQQAFLQQLALALVADTNTGPDMTDHVDERGLLTRVEAPIVDENAAAANKKERLQLQKDKQPPANGAPVNGNGNGVQIDKRAATALKRVSRLAGGGNQ